MRRVGAGEAGGAGEGGWANADASREEIATVTLDTFAREAGHDWRRPAVIKLDVEGCEIPALRGAARLLQGDCLVIYEDHGADASHETTRFILSLPDFEVRYVRTDGRVLRVNGLKELGSIKRDPGHGYNFAATRRGSPFDRLLRRHEAD